MTDLNTASGAVTRLTVNIGPRTAEALNWLAAEDGLTNTEALRRLVALGYLVTRKVREEDVLCPAPQRADDAGDFDPVVPLT